MDIVTGTIGEVYLADQGLSTIRIMVEGQRDPVIVSAPRGTIRELLGEMDSGDWVKLSIEVTQPPVKEAREAPSPVPRRGSKSPVPGEEK